MEEPLPMQRPGEPDGSRIEHRATNLSHVVQEATDADYIGVSRRIQWVELIGLLRPGFMLNHLDWKSVVIASRSYFQLITLIFITLVPKVNIWFGSAPFLVNVSGIWDPPGGFSLFAGIFMAAGHVFAASLSFLVFVVMHAINWRIGGYMTETQVYASYSQCSTGDSLCLSTALLGGEYLNIRKTAVTIFAIVASLWLNWMLSSWRPYLRFMWFYGMITILITAPEAAHDPLFRPWFWAQSPIIGFGIAAAVKVFLCTFWVPFTSSEKIADWMSSTLGLLKTNTDEMFEHESKADPRDLEFNRQMEKYPQVIDSILAKSTSISFDMLVCKYEIAYSRFDWRDLHEMATRIKSIGNVFYNFYFTYSELSDRVQAAYDTTADSTFDCHTRRSRNEPNALKSWIQKRTTQNYQSVGKYEEDRHLEYVANDQVLRRLPKAEIDVFFHSITEHYRPLRESASHLMEVVQSWISDANQFRVWSLLSPSYRRECIRKQRENAKSLADAMQRMGTIYDEISADFLWTSRTLLKEEHDKGTRSYILGYSLHYGFITKEYVRHIRNLGKWLIYLDKTQALPLWTLHKGVMKRSEKMNATEAEHQHADMDVPAERVPYRPPTSTLRRDPNASPPRTLVHLFFTKLFNFKQRYWTPRVLYSAKVGFTAIVALIPFFVRTSLEFTHNHRGIWCAIICMISMNASSADSIFGYVSRILATILGCGIGVAAWYISAGNTDAGNPYGMGAVLAVLGVPLIFFRHFNTVGGLVMNIVMPLTIILVTVGSYQQKHNPALQLVFQQSGGALALERLITVIIGMTIAFIATIVPNTNTTKNSVRLRLSRNLQAIGDIQSDVLNYAFQRYDDPHVHRDIYKDLIIRKIRAGFHLNRDIEYQLSMLRFEPPLTGIWPKHQYKLFARMEEQLIHLQPLIYNLITRIERNENIPVLLECMGWTNPRILGSLSSVIFMGSAAIERAEPLPVITPGHITEEYQSFLMRLFDKGGWKGLGYETELSKTHDGKLILVGMVLAEIFYQRIDAVFLVIKSLVGEYGATDRRAWEGFNVV